MFSRRSLFIPTLVAFLLGVAVPAHGQQEALESITGSELLTHLKFVSADEFMGRNTPSRELKIAARYLATQVENFGFKPLMPDGSYFQRFPLETTSLSESESFLRAAGRTFLFPDDFGGRFFSDGSCAGEVVLVGYGVEAPDLEWDDYADLDLDGKIVVMLDGELPDDHPLMQSQNRHLQMTRRTAPRKKGAALILHVISEGLDREMEESGSSFRVYRRTRRAGQTQQSGSMQFFPTPQIDIRHEVAAAILGISTTELSGLFRALSNGERVPGRAYPDRHVELMLKLKIEEDYTQNVVAILEGSDPQLKSEYVLFGSHYDHIGITSGAYPDSICNGADDDGSGTVAMLEIAEAMSITRPKRSVVMVWHTGEEKGLWGSRHFVDDCPIPLENISAQLQMDMLSRNAPDSIYVIGTHFLSSELDEINKEVARRLGIIELDNNYNDPDKRGNFHRQSDHYAYHQVGIPAIFYFCGTHEDLHRPSDSVDKCNMDKLERVTRLIYAVGLEVGNYPHLLVLDRNPEVTRRGKRN
ncbi:MAG: M28 family peptidase [Candidatus Latescibacteria bacterium]|nr:M28 family peptidase [Candidatus Latescibacterota bacterium]